MTAEGFFKELNRLIRVNPKLPLKIMFSEDCEYSDQLSYCKNIKYSFDTANCTNSVYIYDSYMCDKSQDCDYAVESQLCYESVDPFKAFNCDFVNYCDVIRDSSYCVRCSNSHDLFGCVNLNGKSYCIFNRQLTEAEYRERVKKYKNWPYEKIMAIVEDLKKRYPMTQTIAAYNENSEYGNYIHFNKNCYMSFDAAHDENSAYLYDTFYTKNSMDMTYGEVNVDLSYELIVSANVFNSNYVYYSDQCVDSSYIFDCTDVKNCLGCAALKHQQYCILNRQFTKEEYERVSSQILQELKASNLGWADLKV